MRTVHRNNGANDEQNSEGTLTSAVLQEALLNMPLSVHIGMRGYALYPAAFSACAGTLYPAGRSSTATVVSEQDEGTASLQ